jgi:hypothetical protein
MPNLFQFASTSDLLALTGSIFTSVWPLIALVIGVPLGFFIIEMIIGSMKHARNIAYNEGYLGGVRAGERAVGRERGTEAGRAMAETHSIDEDEDLSTPY